MGTRVGAQPAAPLLRSPARGAAWPHALLAALLLAVTDQLGHLVLKPAPLLLIARTLHRREVALHVAILVAIDLLQLELVFLSLVHQLLHAVFVGLPRTQRLALLLVPLLGGLHLDRLVVAQAQGRAHMLIPALPDLLAQLPSFGGVGRDGTRVAPLLRAERRRQRDHENPREPRHHPSSERSSSRNWGAVRSSRLASAGYTGAASSVGCSTISRSCCN